MPHDDPAIGGNSSLIRHINPDFHVFFDENRGRRRISSAAFSATSDAPDFGMSVDIGQLLDERGLSETKHVPPGMDAVRMQVANIRSLALRVGSDPLPENDEHGQAWGVKPSKRGKIHGVVEDWVVAIPGVAIR